MTRNIRYDNVAETVVKAYCEAPDKRTRQILSKLILYLHEFVRDVKLTPAESKAATEFLLRAAKVTREQRNKFILQSDLLGVSTLVNLIDGVGGEGASITAVMGRLYAPISSIWATGPA